jgi:hypothetical protein
MKQYQFSSSEAITSYCILKDKKPGYERGKSIQVNAVVLFEHLSRYNLSWS